MLRSLSMKLMNLAHRAVIAVSGGRFGWDIGEMPVIELSTTGRKTGKQRSTLLTAPLRVNGSYLVVASRGGDDRHPAWYLNLRENPHVEIVIKGGAREPRLARIADEAERAVLWPQVTEKYSNYGRYQTKTEREIPLVLLDPLDP